ncbi:MAG: hypothetical protein AAF492_04645, partial [Verrucomicrobiota bacterium]
VFGDIDSPWLILSIKFGESDFFRYLPLNKQFFRTRHRKIVELQARREYEGCGEYPSCTAEDYYAYRVALETVPNLVGIQVWCQTGGWTRFQRLTFLDRSSIWNEINTWTSIRIFKDRLTPEEAVRQYAATFLSPDQGAPLFELLQHSEAAIKMLLYVDDFARRKLFFRRVRLPSIISVYWDRILVLPSVRKLLRCFVQDGERAIRQGEEALGRIDAMRDLAAEHDLPDMGIEFMQDTFAMLAKARLYYFQPFNPGLMHSLQEDVQRYKQTYETRYTVRISTSQFPLRTHQMRWITGALLRSQRGYRPFDQVVTIRILSVLYPLLNRIGRPYLPEFIQKQAMGLETIFK